MDYASSLSFMDMWNLIVDRNYSYEFTSELLIGIFWEETMFQNRRQMGGGPAVGFGQVEKQIITAVNQHFGYAYSPEIILMSDGLSVEITIDVLTMLRQKMPGNTRRAILDGYAGTYYRKENGKKVQQWINCEDILKPVTYYDADVATRALKAAEPNHTKAIPYVLGDLG